MGSTGSIGRWKTVGAVVLGAGALVVIGAFAPAMTGQGSQPERGARVFQGMSPMNLFRGQIGVTVRDVRPGETEGPGRVAVESVREGSPAEQAGIRVGDVIVEFDGERVRSTRQFSRLVDETPEGHSAQLAVSRGGQRVALNVTPERQSAFGVAPLERWRRPGGEGAPPAPLMREFDFEMPEIEVFTSRRSTLGVQVQGLTDQLAAHLGVKHGVLVTSVDPETPAARAGLKAGDVITGIDGMTVEDPSDLRRRMRRLEGDREFAIEVTRDRKALTLKGRTHPTKTERF